MSELELLVRELDTQNMLYLKYQELSQYSKDRLCEIVIQLCKEDPPLNQDVMFLKRFTKKAELLINEHNPNWVRLDSETKIKIYKKIYDLNMEGFKKIETSHNYEDNPYSTKMRYHFLGHAGSIAFSLFKMNNDPDWAEKGFDASLRAAGLALESNDHEYAVTCAFKLGATIANSAFHLTQNLVWAKKWLYTNLELAEIASKIQYLKEEAEAYRWAGNAASELYRNTDLKGYRNMAIDYYGRFIEYQLSINRPESQELINQTRIKIEEVK